MTLTETHQSPGAACKGVRHLDELRRDPYPLALLAHTAAPQSKPSRAGANRNRRNLRRPQPEQKFTVLSDPGAEVIKRYGILDESTGIALDTTLFIDTNGRERWRYVSATLPDLPGAEETLKHIRDSLSQTVTSSKGRVQ